MKQNKNLHVLLAGASGLVGGCLLQLLTESNQIEKIVFYSQFTVQTVWNEIDLLLTANPDLLLNHPTDKKIIKYNTNYNTNITDLPNIDNIKELKNLIENDTNLE